MFFGAVNITGRTEVRAFDFFVSWRPVPLCCSCCLPCFSDGYRNKFWTAACFVVYPSGMTK